MSRKGFTLAEILITLTVIGVVAALTIPTLLQNTNQAELKTAWKKKYGEISQTVMLLMNDNGGSMKALCGSTGDFEITCLNDLYGNKINYIKKCDALVAYGNCWHNWHPSDGYYPSTFKYLNGSSFHLNDVWGYFNEFAGGYILNDGTLLLTVYHDAGCTSAGGTVNPNYGYETYNGCGWINVDVNGFRGPNRVGKDIFGVWILENGIKPVGIEKYGNTCSTSNTGTGCAALYLYQ